MARTVFILGAGASVESGAPLMREFLDRGRDLSRGMSRAARGPFDLVDEGVHALTRVHSKATLDIRNVETVFAAFEMAALFGQLGDLPPERVAALPDAIRKVIVQTIERGMEFPLQSGSGEVSATRPYHAFAHALSLIDKTAALAPAGVVSFNYDIGLDHALELAGYNVDYCLNDERPDYDNRVELAKLHGSLNWSACSDCGFVQSTHVRDYLKRHGDRYQAFSRGGGSTAAKVAGIPISEDLSPVHEGCSSPSVVPFIVPPTWSKGEYHRQIAVVWRRAAQMLSEAENIIVMGYSWPPSDQFFHHLFAIGTLGRAFLRRFWIFDTNQNISQRYADLLGPQATAHGVFDTFNMTFSRGARELFLHLTGNPEAKR